MIDVTLPSVGQTTLAEVFQISEQIELKMVEHRVTAGLGRKNQGPGSPQPPAPIGQGRKKIKDHTKGGGAVQPLASFIA